ncbi:tetratricopeptide repeat protein [uncultured Clostridium sp.]|uniref:tetratricopeptide repeat protein n=1 Tax=uncultured Clostridium sp. TaxID=59620 RepID=UPI0032179817
MNFEENFDMGEKYYINGEYEKAIEYFENCYKINKSNDCLNYIGCCYLGIKDYNAAIKIFNSIIEDCPNSERPVFNLSRVYMKLGELDTALDNFKKAITINPYSEDGYYYLGVYHQQVGELEMAKMYYKKSLEIDNEQSETYLNLGICCFELKLYEEALESFSNSYKYDRECVEAIQNKALVYIEMNDYERALKELYAFSILQPDDIDNVLDIAHCYYKILDFKNSYVWCKKALIIDSDNTFANKLLKILSLKLRE